MSSSSTSPSSGIAHVPAEIVAALGDRIFDAQTEHAGMWLPGIMAESVLFGACVTILASGGGILTADQECTLCSCFTSWQWHCESGPFNPDEILTSICRRRRLKSLTKSVMTLLCAIMYIAALIHWAVAASTANTAYNRMGVTLTAAMLCAPVVVNKTTASFAECPSDEQSLTTPYLSQHLAIFLMINVRGRAGMALRECMLTINVVGHPQRHHRLLEGMHRVCKESSCLIRVDGACHWHYWYVTHLIIPGINDITGYSHVDLQCDHRGILSPD